MSRSRSEKLSRFSKERVSEDDTFRCRKCRIYLFSFDNLTSFHKKIEPVEQCSAWYLNCDDDIDDDIDGNDFMIWVKEAINKSQWTEGKIYCPKCTSRIGAFNITQGVKCGCFAFVIPAVWIQKCKVDQVMTADLKLDISFPRQPNNPNGKNGNGQPSQSSQTGSKTSQTGSQTSQTESQTSQTESQTSQTGSQTSQARLQMSQAGLQTCQTDSQDLISQSKTCASLSGSLSELSGPQLDCLPGPSRMIPGLGSPHIGQSQLDSSPDRSGFHIAADPQATGSQTDLSSSTSQAFQFDSEPVLEILDHTHNYDYIDYGEGCISDCEYHEIQSCHPSNVCKRRKYKVTKSNQSEENTCDKDLYKTRNTDRSFSDEDSQEETDDIPEHLICPVCLDLLYEPLFCPCTHVFCDSCLRLLNSKCKITPKCPLCRKSLRYVYPAVELREEIRKTFPNLYRNRHRIERRAVHRRLPLPNSRLKPRRKKADNMQDIAMPYGVVMFLICVLAVSVLCLVILFVFCPPTSNRCITVIGYE